MIGESPADNRLFLHHFQTNLRPPLPAERLPAPEQNFTFCSLYKAPAATIFPVIHKDACQFEQIMNILISNNRNPPTPPPKPVWFPRHSSRRGVRPAVVNRPLIKEWPLKLEDGSMSYMLREMASFGALVTFIAGLALWADIAGRAAF